MWQNVTSSFPSLAGWHFNISQLVLCLWKLNINQKHEDTVYLSSLSEFGRLAVISWVPPSLLYTIPLSTHILKH